MKQKISFVTWMANLHINFFTLRNGVLVGTDKAGNRYYTEKSPRKGAKRVRRWVIYNGEPEASKVPPEWHGWLHHTVNEPLPENSPFHRPWQKEHQPNLTGTLQAYRPSGHVFEGSQRARATGDYEPWTPS
ncbi:NADH:ubiquinone oxidoreductase subunit NDUFA12 [Oleisolibacter albus]|uniref:NADH:ubiquinone oxidoreductase subunit NDUFA12 n=1 Tax=Oleisolibacter albus TaxID=2171757 RepID=UPI000DF3DE93|nr:NADH:ubiquinone oxidoreductase subunit NDUFA12 [Oleisolibacter albus]